MFREMFCKTTALNNKSTVPGVRILKYLKEVSLSYILFSSILCVLEGSFLVVLVTNWKILFFFLPQAQAG